MRKRLPYRAIRNFAWPMAMKSCSWFKAGLKIRCTPGVTQMFDENRILQYVSNPN